MTKLNIAKLKTDLKTITQEILAVKAILRESGQPRKTYRTYNELKALKRRATLLCSIRAHHRGKIHLKDSTLDKQAAFIGDAWEDYQHTDKAA